MTIVCRVWHVRSHWAGESVWWFCHRYKGPNVGSCDPDTGRLVPFFIHGSKLGRPTLPGKAPPSSRWPRKGESQWRLRAWTMLTVSLSANACWQQVSMGEPGNGSPKLFQR